MILIDKYAYKSKLKQTDPLQKVIFAFLTLAVCIWADHELISLAVIFIMGFVTVIRGGTSPRFYCKLLLVPMSFLFIGVFTIAVNVSKQSVGLLSPISVAGIWIGFSHTGLQEAGRLFLKAMGSVSCLYFLSLNTPMVDILAALRSLRFPKLLVELMGLVYRFIFILLETADTIYNAQNCRLGYRNLSTGYRSIGALASMLFIRSYKRSDEIYTALEARGYEGELNVLEEAYEKHWLGYFLITAVNVLLIAAAIVLK